MVLRASWLPSPVCCALPFSSRTSDTSSSRDLRFLQTPGGALDFMLSGKFCLAKIPRTRKHEGAWESAQKGGKWKILRIQINMNWIQWRWRSENIKWMEVNGKRCMGGRGREDLADTDRFLLSISFQRSWTDCCISKAFFLQSPPRLVSLGFVSYNGISVVPPWGHPD